MFFRHVSTLRWKRRYCSAWNCGLFPTESTSRIHSVPPVSACDIATLSCVETRGNLQSAQPRTHVRTWPFERTVFHLAITILKKTQLYTVETSTEAQNLAPSLKSRFFTNGFAARIWKRRMLSLNFEVTWEKISSKSGWTCQIKSHLVEYFGHKEWKPGPGIGAKIRCVRLKMAVFLKNPER